MSSGAGMAVDIGEQPEVLARLIEPAFTDRVAAVAAAVIARAPRHVVFAARGSSAHAARYAAYLCEVRLGLPAGLASPSTVTVLGARPDLSAALVVAVDREGASPDLVEVLRVARERGAMTLAVTNDPGSALADAAGYALDTGVGPERALAATKSYTAALLTLSILVESVRGGGELPDAERASLAVLPDLAALTLADPAPVELADRYRFAHRLLTTGCGYGHPTARQAALTLMETSYLAALACASATLRRGPLAMVDPELPVLAVVGDGPGGQATRSALAGLGERRADVVTVGPRPVSGATAHLRVPALEERVAPVLDILPLQRFALALARCRDPDPPHGSTVGGLDPRLSTR